MWGTGTPHRASHIGRPFQPVVEGRRDARRRGKPSHGSARLLAVDRFSRGQEVLAARRARSGRHASNGGVISVQGAGDARDTVNLAAVARWRIGPAERHARGVQVLAARRSTSRRFAFYADHPAEELGARHPPGTRKRS